MAKTKTRAAKTTKKPITVMALKCYFPKRDAAGVVTTNVRVLCPKHYLGLFSFEPSAYGCGEYLPVECCELCKKGA